MGIETRRRILSVVRVHRLVQCGGDQMIHQNLKRMATDLAELLKKPRNEAERFKRDWAIALVEDNEALAYDKWKDYCRYMRQCGIDER